MSVKLPIYLDHHATTPVDHEVLDAMLPYFSDIFGNAASKNHSFGLEAHQAVEQARATIARAVKAKPQEICFTSGATEAINLAIKGMFKMFRERGGHFISVATEHKAVLESLKRIESWGAEVTMLPVNRDGLLDPTDVAGAIRPDTVMVCVMIANNEIGVIQPITEIGGICRDRDVFFMTDATQALGKIPIDVQRMNIDLLACSAHKIYGPKGVGALFARRSNPRVKLHPLIDGGGHERGIRSGTLNVPGVVGFAKAVEISLKTMKTEQKRLRKLRDSLWSGLSERLDDIVLNGHPDMRLAGNLNVCIRGVESEALVIALKDCVALSTGSACTTEKVQPSHVLSALGMSDGDVHSSVRFGIGRFNMEEELSCVTDVLAREVCRLRALV